MLITDFRSSAAILIVIRERLTRWVMKVTRKSVFDFRLLDLVNGESFTLPKFRNMYNPLIPASFFFYE